MKSLLLITIITFCMQNAFTQEINLPFGGTIEVQLIQKDHAMSEGSWTNQDFQVNKFFSMDIWVNENGSVWEQYDHLNNGFLYISLEEFKSSRGSGLKYMGIIPGKEFPLNFFQLPYEKSKVLLESVQFKELESEDEHSRLLLFEDGRVWSQPSPKGLGELFPSILEYNQYLKEYVGEDYFIVVPDVNPPQKD